MKPTIYSGNPKDFEKPWSEDDKERLNKALVSIFRENKMKKKFNLDKACTEALERVENYIDTLYHIEKESIRINFELAEMTMLLEQHVGTKDEALIVGLTRDLELQRSIYMGKSKR